MPYQNRVNPFGRIIASPARGTLMGNRGCLHDRQTHPVRLYQGRRWIICVLEFKNRTRQPMPPGQYTSLFFIDEATALAAGHRPCAECQRQRFNDFRMHWAAANPENTDSLTPLVATIDATLHRERISAEYLQHEKRKLTYSEHLDRLPDGAFITLGENASAYVVYGNALFPWDVAGYGQPIARPNTTVQVLTPRSTVLAIAHGYQPHMHPSLEHNTQQFR